MNWQDFGSAKEFHDYKAMARLFDLGRRATLCVFTLNVIVILFLWGLSWHLAL